MPSYRLNTTRESSNRRYKREELQEKTTLQLREICYAEKIVKGVINTLERDALIRLILKYRGVEESLLIRNFRAEGVSRISEICSQYLNNKIFDDGKIKIPAKIFLYKDIGVHKADMYRVIVENEIEESNVIMINEEYQVCGIFNLMRELSQNNLFYLRADHENILIEKRNSKNYYFLFFKKEESEYLYRAYYSEKVVPPANFQYYKILVNDLEIRELEETEIVLAIDFGTSNSTAGVYLSDNYISSPCYNDLLNERITLNEINFVKFLDVTKREERWVEALPTVVYVEKCDEAPNIKYCFGYEAKHLMKRNDYTGNATVFHGIKRWINDYNKEEEIFDEKGNMARVKRGEVIRAYLEHIITAAEQQFKCRFRYLHISSPVKLKQQFVDMFQEILEEYRIETEEMLDEGLAVLYNTIADQIEKSRFIDGEEYKALVIDCGGGTTDLSSCAFRIEEGDICYYVDINTKFENGDTNFGGNNITYRIMQFMKIVFANYYLKRKELIDIDQLMEIPSGDIFRCVDEMGVKEIYKKFETYYAEAEKVIPTRYREYEKNVRESYQRVKNNFYFLWEIADNMKKEFFQKTNILRNRFNASEIDDQEGDLYIIALNKWCLSVFDGELKDVYEFPDVVFNIKEINKLIKADIYDVVRKFLESFYENRTLQDYSIIKLTGQSCRIDIFKEALKEFVPGRSIEFKQKQEDDEYVPDLKLACLRGVLRYHNSKKIGDIEATITNDIPVSPYSVSALTYNKQEKVLICSMEEINQAKGHISRPIGVMEIEFFLKNQQGNLKQKYVFNNKFSDYNLTFPEEITKKFPAIWQEDTDTIRNGEVRFFLFAHERNWGFHAVPIARKEEQLYLGNKKFFAFENDLSELDFFDGLK